MSVSLKCKNQRFLKFFFSPQAPLAFVSKNISILANSAATSLICIFIQILANCDTLNYKIYRFLCRNQLILNFFYIFRAREQPDINADEAMFDTLDVSSVSSSSLDRSASSWTSLLNRHKRQTSADRIQPPGELATASHQLATANNTAAVVAEQQQSGTIQPKTENYRQQLIIPDDTNTASLINTSIEETQGNSNNAYMDDASNPSSASNIVMNDKTQVTSPTSQFGNLSFHQVSAQEPLSFAGILLYQNSSKLCSTL